jgi:hypothetical protein
LAAEFALQSLPVLKRSPKRIRRHLGRAFEDGIFDDCIGGTHKFSLA